MAKAIPTYCRTAPSNQTMADIFAGAWLSRFPVDLGVRAGDTPHFDDGRVSWAVSALPGGLRDRSILELGPFEAYNTYQFCKLGARSVTAVEANDVNFLKCLIVKELTGMHARLLYGDFVEYLQSASERFDIVWASGVLYHQADPVRFLELAGRVSDRLFLHTHYFDADAIGNRPSLEHFFNPALDRTTQVAGTPVKLHYRQYKEIKRTLFAGGPERHSFWLEKDGLFACLKSNGMRDIRVFVDESDSVNGPAIVLLASRPQSA